MITVLWEDDFILVVNKPAGMPTLPDGWSPEVPFVRKYLEEKYGRGNRLWIVHRLDRETSGVLVLARNPGAHQALNRQFEQHSTQKIYHAIVQGTPDWDFQSVSLSLRVNVGHRHRTVVDAQRGKPSLTDLRVLERFNDCALVQAEPRTGRTHQIRAHLAAIGFPILGDRLYFDPANPPVVPIPQRLLLHAYSLTLCHPGTNQLCTYQAPYPDDFDHYLCNQRSMNVSSR